MLAQALSTRKADKNNRVSKCPIVLLAKQQRKGLAALITRNTRQVSLCRAVLQRIGGTFSSRVSEQCSSVHVGETHRTRTSLPIRRGLAKHCCFNIFMLHPSGALPHLPYFFLRKKQRRTFGTHAYRRYQHSNFCLANQVSEVLPCFDREPRSAHVRASCARLAVTCHKVTEGSA